MYSGAPLAGLGATGAGGGLTDPVAAAASVGVTLPAGFSSWSDFYNYLGFFPGQFVDHLDYDSSYASLADRTAAGARTTANFGTAVTQEPDATAFVMGWMTLHQFHAGPQYPIDVRYTAAEVLPNLQSLKALASPAAIAIYNAAIRRIVPALFANVVPLLPDTPPTPPGTVFISGRLTGGTDYFAPLTSIVEGPVALPDGVQYLVLLQGKWLDPFAPGFSWVDGSQVAFTWNGPSFVPGELLNVGVRPGSCYPLKPGTGRWYLHAALTGDTGPCSGVPIGWNQGFGLVSARARQLLSGGMTAPLPLILPAPQFQSAPLPPELVTALTRQPTTTNPAGDTIVPVRQQVVAPAALYAPPPLPGVMPTPTMRLVPPPLPSGPPLYMPPVTVAPPSTPPPVVQQLPQTLYLSPPTVGPGFDVTPSSTPATSASAPSTGVSFGTLALLAVAGFGVYEVTRARRR